MSSRAQRYLAKRHQSKLDAAFLRAFREDARREQNSKCDYCRDPITARTATADHVVARASFGKDHRNNIVAACAHCNVTKGKMSASDFRRLIETPRPTGSMRVLLAWSRLRINRRLELMERRVMRCASVSP